MKRLLNGKQYVQSARQNNTEGQPLEVMLTGQQEVQDDQDSAIKFEDTHSAPAG